MAMLDNDWGSMFGTGSSSLGGSGFDWGSVGASDGFGGIFSGAASSGSGSGMWGSLIGGLFGGGNNSGGGSNIFGAMLSGLSGAAGSWLDSKNSEKAMKQKGVEDRKTLAFGADLQDYYQQKNKVRKRTALDTYGQFSQLSRWAPNYKDTPPIDQPIKPLPG